MVLGSILASLLMLFFFYLFDHLKYVLNGRILVPFLLCASTAALFGYAMLVMHTGTFQRPDIESEFVSIAFLPASTFEESRV
ncbi:MAG: hypothetical protein GKR90_25570 [Pseudomonadales bacterium]|nr:hypothetical protein [Pseudomonadales bacterium]